MSDQNQPYNELADGSRWYFDNPPTTLGIGTVAFSLSQLARWGGQCKLVQGRVYNVAQHSIKVSYLVESLAALMHDSHEIIVGDQCTPVKQYIRQRTNAFKALDIISARAMARIFKYEYPLDPAIKKADTLIGLIESFDLMPNNGKDLWWTVGQPEEIELARELYISRPELRPEAWSPTESCKNFVARYLELKNDNR